MIVFLRVNVHECPLLLVQVFYPRSILLKLHRVQQRIAFLRYVPRQASVRLLHHTSIKCFLGHHYVAIGVHWLLSVELFLFWYYLEHFLVVTYVLEAIRSCIKAHILLHSQQLILKHFIIPLLLLNYQVHAVDSLISEDG